MAKHDRRDQLRAQRRENREARRLMRHQARVLRWGLLRSRFRVAGKGTRGKKVTTPER
jgi:hypothetical protein